LTFYYNLFSKYHAKSYQKIGAPGGNKDREIRLKDLGYSMSLIKPPQPSSALVNIKAPEGAAIILYTSGTTGRPKGVILSHENLLCECSFVANTQQLGPNDKALCLLPIYHVNGLVVTLLTPLWVGFEVVMPPKFSRSKFWNWIVNHRPTWFSAVPAILSIALGEPIPERGLINSLRFARCASAPLPVAVFYEFEKKTLVPVIESFGISEGSGQITSNPLPPAQRIAGSVGLPFGCEVTILNMDLNPVPTGTEGQVAIRGPNVFSTYWQDKESTEKSFVGQWFLTGDLGFLDANGYLFLKGRLKELINRAGEMIAPREIDEVLSLYPGVETAAAVGVPHPIYGEEVAAFVTMRPGVKIDFNDLKQFCLKRLSPFKSPKNFFELEELPKGPNGKIQRLKLVDVYLKLANENKELGESS
jgi:acyl-CoA synthetase (AMP-forming)/AMP-acid ligase II